MSDIDNALASRATNVRKLRNRIGVLEIEKQILSDNIKMLKSELDKASLSLDDISERRDAREQMLLPEPQLQGSLL